MGRVILGVRWSQVELRSMETARRDWDGENGKKCDERQEVRRGEVERGRGGRGNVREGNGREKWKRKRNDSWRQVMKSLVDMVKAMGVRAMATERSLSLANVIKPTLRRSSTYPRS